MFANVHKLKKADPWSHIAGIPVTKECLNTNLYLSRAQTYWQDVTVLIVTAPALKENVMYQGHLTHLSHGHSSVLLAPLFYSFLIYGSQRAEALQDDILNTSIPQVIFFLRRSTKTKRGCLGSFVRFTIFVKMLICVNRVFPLSVNPIIIFNI